MVAIWTTTPDFCCLQYLYPITTKLPHHLSANTNIHLWYMTIIVADSYDKVTMNVVGIVLNQGEYAQNHIYVPSSL